MNQNWKTYKLGDVLQLKRGYDLPSRIREKGIIPIISSSGITDFHSTSKVKPPGVVTGRYGTIGQVFYSNEDFWPLNTTLYVRDFKGNYPKFIYYLLQTIDYKAHSTKSAVPGVDRNDLHEDIINLPPLPIQRRIASILGALDDKIELNLEINKTLEEMAMALYKHWFVGFGPFKDGNFVESELGMIPEGWEVKRIEDVVELIIDHRGKTPKKLGGDWSEKTDTCFEAISAKNIKAGKIVKPETIKYLSNELYQKWMKDPLRDKDILITSEAPIGEHYFILNKTDYCLSQRLFGIRSNPQIFCPELLYCFIISSSGQQQLLGRGSGSTVQGIKQSELRKLSVIVPKMNEQKRVAENLLDYYRMMRNNDFENDILTSLRDALLPKLISGEVEVKAAEEEVSNAV